MVNIGPDCHRITKGLSGLSAGLSVREAAQKRRHEGVYCLPAKYLKVLRKEATGRKMRSNEAIQPFPPIPYGITQTF